MRVRTLARPPIQPWMRRRYYGDGEAPTEDISVTPKTAAAGLSIWILGGVLTHVATRLVDKWFFKGG